MNGLDLIRADNPHRAPLGDYIGLAQMPERLLDDPLVGVDCRGLLESERRLLLRQSRKRFEPTKSAVAIAATLQDMLWGRVMLGNPLLAENRQRTMQVLSRRGQSIIDKEPWLPRFADALIITGCTGMGKTATINRYLSFIPQFHVHARCDEAEWAKHVQITYLIVPMPVHRGGLLYGILSAIDTVIGTDYRITYGDHRRWPIEKLAVEVGIILVQHAVGLLVIEEIQARNFGSSPNREEMLLFILRILNFGTPVVLVGNPLGFVGLESFTQDLSRLTENDPIHLMPADSTDPEWAEGLGPGMWSHNVMPEPTPWSSDIGEALYAASAAFPGFARKAVDAAQLSALAGAEKSVDARHLRRFMAESSTFAMHRDLIEGFSEKDPKKLMQFQDVPWEAYGLKWGALTLADIADGPTDADQSVGGNLPVEDARAFQSVHARLRAKARAEQTRAGKKTDRAKGRADDGANPVAEALSRGMNELRRTVEAKGSTMSRDAQR